MRPADRITADVNAAVAAHDADALMELSQEFIDQGDVKGAAGAIGNSAVIHALRGDYPRALELYENSLAMFESIGNRAVTADVTNNIGNVYVAVGDYPRALDEYQKALAIHEELADRASIARVTGNMGNVYANIGELEKASEFYERSKVINEELNDLPGISSALSNLGTMDASMDRLPEALEKYAQALAIAEELNDPAKIARYLVNIVTVLLKQGSDDEAALLVDRLAQMTVDDPDVRIEIAVAQATLLEHRGNTEQAREILLQAVGMATEAGLKMHAANIHRQLRDLARHRNDLEDYIVHDDEYDRIMEEISGQKVTQQLDMIEVQQKLEALRRQREKEQAVLYGALPKEIADRLIGGDDVSGDEFDEATVLFLDITESTRHSSALSAKQVVSLLSDMFSTFDDITAEHGLMKIKTIGDAYMAVAFPESGEQGPESGERRAESDHAVRAVRAAMAMMASPFTWPDGSTVQFRVGMHVGPLVAGIIGKQRLQYDVWGDTVNVASRMESTSEPGRIQVSEAFANALRANEERDARCEKPGARSEELGAGSQEEEGSGLRSPVSGLRPLLSALRERGVVQVKGKGAMTTYWLLP